MRWFGRSGLAVLRLIIDINLILPQIACGAVEPQVVNCLWVTITLTHMWITPWIRKEAREPEEQISLIQNLPGLGRAGKNCELNPDNLNGDRELDIGMRFDCHHVGSDLFDPLVEVDHLPIDLNSGLFGYGLSDISR